MKRFLKKALRWSAILGATLIALLLAFYAEEDWRGARDWAACQRDLAATGETLDLRQLIPPGKPEDDLSKVPIFAEMYQAQRDYDKNQKSFSTLRINKINIGFNPKYSTSKPKAADYFKNESFDLTAWQKFYRSIPEAKLPQPAGTPAQDVLVAINQFNPELDEIRGAVSNPNAYWPINYESPFEGYMGTIVKSVEIAKVIQLEGIAHLDNHQPDLAAKDYLFSVQLNRTLAQACFTDNYFVIAAVRTIDDSILREGLQQHAWNDTQLREMESALSSPDLLALAIDSFRLERASAVKTMVEMHSSSAMIRKALQSEADAFYYLYLTENIRPNGWWNQDQTAYSYGTQKLIANIDPTRGTLNPIGFPSHPVTGWLQIQDASLWEEIYTPLSSTSLPFLNNMGPKIAKAETYRRLARLACRLEEYRIAHNSQYPEKLADLPDLPAHLNQEVLSEQPLQYHRKGDGYALYSLGWNQKDDGGVYATDPKEGDWPWPSP